MRDLRSLTWREKREKSDLCVLVMFHRVLLCVALLTGCTGESSVDGPPRTVQAFAGRDVVLPCSVKITPSDDFPTVEWSKEGLQPNVVFLYRDGCETYEMKNPAFHYRTSFITKELKDGNIALRISDVRLSDAGKYQCMTLWKNAPRDITTVELVVAAVSKPKLSVVSAESGGVTLQCEANCWLPEPKVEFLDDRGNSIPAGHPNRQQDASGCYTVTRRVTLQGATNRVTCRVHQPEINETRDAEILIPVDYMRNSLPTGFAIGEGVLLLLAACGLAAFFLWKRCGKSEEQKTPVTRQSSDQTTMSGTSENQPFLGSVRLDMGNGTIEELGGEVSDLKSKLHEKDETIHQLVNDLKSVVQPAIVYSPSRCSLDVPKPFNPPSDRGPETRDLPVDHSPKPMASTSSNPPISGNVPQNPGPKLGIPGPAPDHPVNRYRRIHSSPDLSDIAPRSTSSSASVSKKKRRSFSRSMSESGARSGPNVPNVQRRHSLVFPLSDKPFTRLPELSEESDYLI